MGHLIFVVLHLAALFFGFAFLVVTIPAHLIYTSIRSSSAKSDAIAKKQLSNTQSVRTHLKCPECAEMIKREANKCRFCGSDVEPVPEVVEEQSTAW